MKLSRSVVQRRIDLMEKEGIVFRTGVNIGKDISAKVCNQSNICFVIKKSFLFLYFGIGIAQQL